MPLAQAADTLASGPCSPRLRCVRLTVTGLTVTGLRCVRLTVTGLAVTRLAVRLLGRRLLQRAVARLPQRAYGLLWCALAAWIAVRPLLVASGVCHR